MESASGLLNFECTIIQCILPCGEKTSRWDLTILTQAVLRDLLHSFPFPSLESYSSFFYPYLYRQPNTTCAHLWCTRNYQIKEPNLRHDYSEVSPILVNRANSNLTAQFWTAQLPGSAEVARYLSLHPKAAATGKGNFWVYSKVVDNGSTRFCAGYLEWYTIAPSIAKVIAAMQSHHHNYFWVRGQHL